MISELYKDHPEKKDGAYTIFYMGVNAGAFFGILLCGYLGEKVGWGYGFGLAGIFMFFGTLQFWLAQNIFGSTGLKPVQKKIDEAALQDGDKRNPFPAWQLVIIGICVVLAMGWLINSPMVKISNGAYKIFNFEWMGYSGNTVAIVTGLILFLFLLIYRLFQYSSVTRDKLIAVTFFDIIATLFWAIFEQSANSLTVFAEKLTVIFNIISMAEFTIMAMLS